LHQFAKLLVCPSGKNKKSTLKKSRCSNHKLAEENMPASMLMIAVDWYGSFDSLKSAKLQSQQSGERISVFCD